MEEKDGVIICVEENVVEEKHAKDEKTKRRGVNKMSYPNVKVYMSSFISFKYRSNTVSH